MPTVNERGWFLIGVSTNDYDWQVSVYGIMRVAFRQIAILDGTGLVEPEDEETIILIGCYTSELAAVLAFLDKYGLERTREITEVDVVTAVKQPSPDAHFALAELIAWGMLPLVRRLLKVGEPLGPDEVEDIQVLLRAYNAQRPKPTIAQFFTNAKRL